nr:hypothetical protein [Acidobacteriota bacterium]
GQQQPAGMRLDLTGTLAAPGAPPQPYRASFDLKRTTPAGGYFHWVPPYRGAAQSELLAILALLVFGIGAGYPVNANRFSMQAGYRNRLIRAYLGASKRNRQPNLFTGFDTNDDVYLSDLRANRPLPVINMALNLVRGGNLAWQERKAESFTATPLHCGAGTLGYRPTAEYGGRKGLTLGTAVATSGAAANPNMGQHSSPAIGFIMAFFNVRLGIWLGNPKSRATYRKNGPRSAARVLVDEAFGLTDAEHPYVSLSDGGHFEDLGLYEMVRRRCRTIFVSDAGADPSYAFDDLGNAIRKIRIDFGIPIVFKERVLIVPRQASGKAEDDARYCAIAEIQYGAVDQGTAPGTLIYIKPSIVPGAPFDVQNYARENPLFPHQSTADQWFSESQFESYRALGENAVEVMAAGGHYPGGGAAPAGLDPFVDRVKEYVKVQKAAGTATTVLPP